MLNQKIDYNELVMPKRNSKEKAFIKEISNLMKENRIKEELGI